MKISLQNIQQSDYACQQQQKHNGCISSKMKKPTTLKSIKHHFTAHSYFATSTQSSVDLMMTI